jgi:hypothetical protein
MKKNNKIKKLIRDNLFEDVRDPHTGRTLSLMSKSTLTTILNMLNEKLDKIENSKGK